MRTKQTPPRRTSGTLTKLQKGLNLSKRQVSALLAAGMPDDLTEARKWRRERMEVSPDFALARARKMTAAADLAELALAEKRGLVIYRAEAEESDRKIGAAVAAFCRRLENEIPQLCLGLTLERSRPICRERIRELQTMLSDQQSEFWAAHPGT